MNSNPRANIHFHSGGQSILEVILALMIFGLIASAMATMVVGSANGLIQGGEYSRAEGLAEEGIEAVRSIRDGAWNRLSYAESGVYDAGGVWDLSGEGTNDIIPPFTRTIQFNDVCRDGAGNITACPGAFRDAESKEVALRVSWETRPGISNSITRTQYLTNWDSADIKDTLKSDFDLGRRNATVATLNDDVTLIEANPFKTSSVHLAVNTSGVENASDVFVDEASDILYLVMRNRASGPEFIAYDISNITDGELTELGSTELGATIAGVYTAKGYAFLATETVGEELMVVRLSDYVKMASWSPPGLADAPASSVSGTGDRVFLGTQADVNAPEWFAADITNPESIPAAPLNSREAGANVNETAISGSHAFIATSNAAADLLVVNLSDYSLTNSVDVDGASAATSVFATTDMAYVGKLAAGGADRELYVFRIADVVGGIDAEFQSVEIGDDVLDVFTEGVYAYVATNDGGNELQVVRLSDYTLFGVGNANGAAPCNRIWFFTAYAYLACRDDGNELQVMKSTVQAGWGASVRYGDADGNAATAADGFAIAISGDYAYLGTQNNAGGPEFFVFDINPAGSGLALVDLLEVGGDVNDIVVGNNAAFLATSHDAKELMRVNIQDPTNIFEIVPAFNASGTADGRSVYQVAGRLYLGTVNNTSSAGACPGSEVYIVRAVDAVCLGGFNAGNAINDIVVNGNYLYAATPQNGAEVAVLDISNPASITVAGSYNAVGGGDGRGLAMDGTDLYLVRADGGADPDFYILNIGAGNETNPGLIGSLNTAADNFRVSVQTGQHAFVGSLEIDRELKVINIQNKAAPAIRGVFDADGIVRDVLYDAATSYAYLATANNALELQIVGAVQPSYPLQGTFTSREFDLLSQKKLQVLKWTETIPACTSPCDIQLLFRSSPVSVNDLRTREWAGPDGVDGDRGDFFADPLGTIIHQTHNNHRYFQYKAILTSDGVWIPELEDATINYK